MQGYNIESCVCNCKISIDFYALNSIECQNFFEVFCKRSKIQKKKSLIRHVKLWNVANFSQLNQIPDTLLRHWEVNKKHTCFFFFGFICNKDEKKMWSASMRKSGYDEPNQPGRPARSAFSTAFRYMLTLNPSIIGLLGLTMF